MYKTCCFSGHRDIPDEELHDVVERTKAAIREHYAKGVRTFKTGGALGFDTLSANLILKMKNEFPDIRLELELIAPTQADGWGDQKLILFRSVFERADAIRYASASYSRPAIFARNRALVDGSDYIICYLKKPVGGTSYTVSYAEKKGIEITNVANGGNYAQ